MQMNQSDAMLTRCVPVCTRSYPLLMRVDTTALAVEWALAFLGCARHLAPKPCIVLDIDGTVLLNRPCGESTCVLHFASLCAACAQNGIKIFCVTARPDDVGNRAYTLRQLEKCRIQPVEEVYMRPPDAGYASYKYKARRTITAAGFSILLSIGDQFADVTRHVPPPELTDDHIYIGQMGDSGQYAIKLRSEFA